MKKQLAVAGFLLAVIPLSGLQAESDPAQIAIGERLTMETRFSYGFFVGKKSEEALEKTLNHTMENSDPMPGAFAGQQMNCRSCHMVDEFADKSGAGMRAYSDFASLSPIPLRMDGVNHTGRNSMSMVNISRGAYSDDARDALLHHDGEFNSMDDLVRATLTGRNFGWLPGEAATAIRHIASVIRSDDGTGELAREFGGSYRDILTGTAKNIPQEFQLPEQYRIDVDTASDKQILDGVAKLVSAYVTDLAFSRNDAGVYNGSAYDKFLEKNNLPRKPVAGELKASYTKRVLAAVEALKQPLFVTAEESRLETHNVASAGFGARELEGMKLFFRPASANANGGNCASCHAAPDFSDFKFHNTGLTELRYDSVHGAGSFAKLDIPSLKNRSRMPERYLPATAKHPRATSRFRQPVSKEKPGVTDLGLWNVYVNTDMPGPQAKIEKILCEQSTKRGANCQPDTLLELAIAAFKTPVLRDQGHSAPYFHDGSVRTIEQAVAIYQQLSAMSQRGRNMAPELKKIRLNSDDVEKIVAFIRSLNEDYD